MFNKSTCPYHVQISNQMQIFTFEYLLPHVSRIDYFIRNWENANIKLQIKCSIFKNCLYEHYLMYACSHINILFFQHKQFSWDLCALCYLWSLIWLNIIKAFAFQQAPSVDFVPGSWYCFVIHLLLSSLWTGYFMTWPYYLAAFNSLRHYTFKE